MEWIRKFHLFLFDFDGLLVNTEPLHYQAYVDVLARRGRRLQLSFNDFFRLAHLNSTAWQEAIYAEIPDLGLKWELLYEEKKKRYLDLIEEGKVSLMPGVEPLLNRLNEAGIQRCVVTHSNREQTERICSHLPILQKRLPLWITREDYVKPKPDPECYLKAIALYRPKGKGGVIGFEDSLRGLRALLGASAKGVIICPKSSPLLQTALDEGGVHFESFETISDVDD